MNSIIDILPKKLDVESDKPMYLQIVEELKKLIATKKINEGDLIPSEMELCNRYNISRTTVRQALDILVDENIITRKRGLGSYVNSCKIHRNLSYVYSFSNDMKKLSVDYNSILIKKEIINAEEDICGKLKIPYGAKVFFIKRIRCVGGEKVIIEETYVPYIICKGIEEIDFENKSLYEVLTKEYEIVMERAVENYEAINIQEEESSLLEISEGEAVFKISRVAYMYNDLPFEHTRAYVRGDRFSFAVQLMNNKNGIKFEKQLNF